MRNERRRRCRWPASAGSWAGATRWCWRRTRMTKAWAAAACSRPAPGPADAARRAGVTGRRRLAPQLAHPPARAAAAICARVRRGRSGRRAGRRPGPRWASCACRTPRRRPKGAVRGGGRRDRRRGSATGAAGTVLAPWRHDARCDHLAAHLMAQEAAPRAGVRHLAYPVWGWTLPETALLDGPAPVGWRLDIGAQLPAKRRAESPRTARSVPA